MTRKTDQATIINQLCSFIKSAQQGDINISLAKFNQANLILQEEETKAAIFTLAAFTCFQTLLKVFNYKQDELIASICANFQIPIEGTLNHAQKRLKNYIQQIIAAYQQNNKPLETISQSLLAPVLKQDDILLNEAVSCIEQSKILIPKISFEKASEKILSKEIDVLISYIKDEEENLGKAKGCLQKTEAELKSYREQQKSLTDNFKHEQDSYRDEYKKDIGKINDAIANLKKPNNRLARIIVSDKNTAPNKFIRFVYNPQQDNFIKKCFRQLLNPFLDKQALKAYQNAQNELIKKREMLQDEQQKFTQDTKVTLKEPQAYLQTKIDNTARLLTSQKGTLKSLESSVKLAKQQLTRLTNISSLSSLSSSDISSQLQELTATQTQQIANSHNTDPYREFYRFSKEIELHHATKKHPESNHLSIDSYRQDVDQYFIRTLELTPTLLDFIKRHVTLNCLAVFPYQLIRTKKDTDNLITKYKQDYSAEESSTYLLSKIPGAGSKVLFECHYRLMKDEQIEIEAQATFLIQEVNGVASAVLIEHSDNFAAWKAAKVAENTGSPSIKLHYHTPINNRKQIEHPIYASDEAGLQIETNLDASLAKEEALASNESSNRMLRGSQPMI